MAQKTFREINAGKPKQGTLAAARMQEFTRPSAAFIIRNTEGEEIEGVCLSFKAVQEFYLEVLHDFAEGEQKIIDRISARIWKAKDIDAKVFNAPEFEYFYVEKFGVRF